MKAFTLFVNGVGHGLSEADYIRRIQRLLDGEAGWGGWAVMVERKSSHPYGYRVIVRQRFPRPCEFSFNPVRTPEDAASRVLEEAIRA